MSSPAGFLAKISAWRRSRPPRAERKRCRKLLVLHLDLGLALRAVIHSGIGQAEHDPPNHSQHQRRIRRPDPTQVLQHGHVQAVVESAFNDPVVPLELEHSQGLQLLQAPAAQQKHHLAGPFAPAFDAGFQTGRQAGARKPDLAGSHCQTL